MCAGGGPHSGGVGSHQGGFSSHFGRASCVLLLCWDETEKRAPLETSERGSRDSGGCRFSACSQATFATRQRASRMKRVIDRFVCRDSFF
jgi:hypothetical protein